MRCEDCRSQEACQRDEFKLCHYSEILPDNPDNPCNTCNTGGCGTCEHRWETQSAIYNSVKGLPMTVDEALQLIVKHENQPALNHAVNYAKYALILLYQAPVDCLSNHEFKLQLAYVLNNMTHWRANKGCTATTADIKECRQVLKEASK